jgi:hypothetical protein
MKMNVYSIYDKATNAYMRPFFLQADGQALRVFTDMAVDAEHEVSKHPEDYSLFRLGSFDDNAGALVGEEPKCVGRAHELAAKSRERGSQLELVENE